MGFGRGKGFTHVTEPLVIGIKTRFQILGGGGKAEVTANLVGTLTFGGGGSNIEKTANLAATGELGLGSYP